jgi:DDE family transposase
MCCLGNMADSVMLETLKEQFEALPPLMREWWRRYWAATEAQALGYGGLAAVPHATGLSRQTSARGLAELAVPQPLSISSPTRSRGPGGGRPAVIEAAPAVLHAVATLIEPPPRGDPMSPLRWPWQSPRQLAEALQQPGPQVGARTVAQVRHALASSQQAHRQSRAGRSHRDRNAQYADINAQGRAGPARGQPVVSMDAKHKALVGDWAHTGQDWQPHGSPEAVGTHDVPAPHLGKARPYGVYDMPTPHGGGSVGLAHETAQCATAPWRRWWQAMGRQRSPQAAPLLVTAASGGSNSRRRRLWKVALHAGADESGLPISVCHFPPGISKWKKIEPRMFGHITEHGRGRPLRRLAVMGNLIGHPTTATGLPIQAALDPHPSPTGLKVSEKEWAAVQRTKATFHGEGHYTIAPRG